MPEEIRGLSVKFDSDFSEFKRGIKSADKDINSTQKKLKSLKDSLKLQWDNRKFSKAQAEAQKALEATEKKASLLRQRLQQMESSGISDKTRDEYNYLSEQLERSEVNAQKLQKELEDLDDIKLSNLTKGLDTAVSKLDKAAKATKAVSLGSAALLGGLTASGMAAVSQADEIATLATQYDMTAEAIQRFNYVALQTDTQSEYLYKAFVKVQGGVADLQTGVESVSTKALRQLGLSFDQFSGKEDQFYAIVDALSTMEDQARMVSLANDIFGERMATNLFPLIYSGTEAVNAYREEFESLGYMTEDQISQLADFDNVMNKLKVQYQNVGLQLGSSLLPVMETFSEILTEDVLPVIRDFVEWFGNLDEGTQKFIVTALLLTATLSPILRILSSLGGGFSSLVSWLAKTDTATFKIYGRWLLLAGAMSSVFKLISGWSKLSAVEKILYSLATAAMVAAAAVAMFHASWSVGLAVGAIVAGIAAIMGAINSASDSLGIDTGESSSGGFSVPEYTIPEQSTQGDSYTENHETYVDNSEVTINIEKNEYMSEEDIIRAVNKGLKRARQARK